MSTLRNQHWLTIAGEPIAGRTPPQLRIYGPELTPVQLGLVARVYKQFTDACQLSVAPRLTSDRVFPDGTRVRCVTLYGVDTVQVWTKPPVLAKDQIAAGFLCVPMWVHPDNRDPIYGALQGWRAWGAPAWRAAAWRAAISGRQASSHRY